MDIVHIDPGYGKGFTTTNSTVLINCVESEEYNPVNGVAFTVNPGATKCYVRFPMPSSLLVAPASYCLKKTSFRFSIYFDTTFSGNFGAGNFDYNQNTQQSTGCSAWLNINPNSCSVTGASESAKTIDIVTHTTGFHDVAISCVVSGKTSSGSCYKMTIVEVDGNSDIQIKSWSTGLNATVGISSNFGFYFHGSLTGCYISNVIIATSFEYTGTVVQLSKDYPPLLTYDTLPVRLPLGAPVTTFTAGDNGEYIGTETGQTLLQSINASDVITKYGAKSNVIWLASYGNPCYRVGSGITQASGISESDGTITSHGTTELSTETDATAFVAWETPETTLSDIDGLKVGWQI